MRFEGVETGSRQDASSLDPIPSLPSVQVCVHLLSKTDCFDLIFSEEAPSLSYAEKLLKAYDEVETFVMFIGYPRSSHSLVGAILDAHPEIIIPHEFNVLQKWRKYNVPEFQRKNLIRYKLYFDLHQTSTEQAMFGKRASRKRTVLGGEFTYLYNVPDLWQGGYKNKIKVGSEDDFHSSWVTITYYSQPKLILKNKEDAPASVAGITR